MSNNTIFEESHGMFKNALIPIVLFNGEFELQFGLDEDLFKEVEVLKEKVPHLVKNIFFIPNQFFTLFVYENKFVQREVFSLKWEVWEQFNLKESIDYWDNEMAEREKEKEYVRIFGSMEKRILIPNYIQYFKEIPNEQKYDCFRDLWTRSEYGFDLFEPAFLKQVFMYRSYSKEHKEEMEKFEKEINGNEIVTIYRGVATKSSSIDKGISWTIDRSIAEFFAKRFNSNGDIYKALIKKEDIYDYLSNRGEKEVLVNPTKIFNVKRDN